MSNATRLGKNAVTLLWLPLALFVLAWVLTTRADSLYFPPIPEIWQALVDDLVDGNLRRDLLYSMRNIAAGLSIGASLGVLLGVVIGENRRLRDAMGLTLDFARSLPKLAFVPIVILAFGLGAGPKIFLISFGSFFPVLLNTISGIEGIDASVRESTRAYRIPRLLRLRRVLLPGALPRILAGIRIALQVAIVMMLVSEIYGSPIGVGHYILNSATTFRIRETWAGTFLIAALGYSLVNLLLLIEHYTLGWYHERVPTKLLFRGAELQGEAVDAGV